MELSDIFLKVFLSLVMDPLFEIVEIENIWVGDLSSGEPLDEEGEVVTDFFSVEDSIDHMAAK